MKHIHLKREPQLLAKMAAFSYQVDAVEAIRNLEYAAIFHEQGLGKTKIAIDLILYWLQETDIDTVLVVTKKQLVANWLREFDIHTHIRPALITSSKADNYYVFNSPARVILTNFEALGTEFERFQLFLSSRNIAIIVDESAKLKNPKSQLTQTFFALSQKFKRRVIMTGTPIANRPYDIWAQIFFLDAGKSLGTDFEAFRNEMDLSNALAGDPKLQEKFEGALSELFDRIRSFSIRETKNSGIVSLPEKVYIREYADFSERQFELYERIRHELIIDVQKNGQMQEDDSSAMVKRLLRLVQVASNPELVDESYKGCCGKEKLLDKLLHEIWQNGEKCIVWTSFIDNVNWFYRKYYEAGSVRIHGGMSMIERNRAVERFRDPEIRVLFATPASAKEGLTLTMANHVIFFDRGFSLDDYLQAQDRIHRISQKKACYIHNLILRGSIDEWVDVLLSAKQSAAQLAQGDIGKEQFSLQIDYSFSDLVREILLPEDKEREQL